MGNRSSRVVENTIEAVNTVALATLVEFHTKIESNLSTKNQNKLVFKGNCVVKNSTFANLVDAQIKSNVTFDTETTTDFQEKLSEALSGGLDNQEDKFLQAVSSYLNPGGKSSTRLASKTTISNYFSSKYDQKTLTELARAINGVNLNDVVCKGKARLKGVTAKNELIAKLDDTVFSKSKNIQDMQRDLEKKLEAYLKNVEESKIYDILSKGLDVAEGIISPAAAVARYASPAVAAIVTASIPKKAAPIQGSPPPSAQGGSTEEAGLMWDDGSGDNTFFIVSSCSSSSLCLLAIGAAAFFMMRNKQP